MIVKSVPQDLLRLSDGIAQVQRKKAGEVELRSIFLKPQ